MCSVNENDLDDVQFMEPAIENVVKDSICIKCGGSGNIFLRKRNVYCKKCFEASVNHKFRAALGKSRLVRPGQQVLLPLSGGLASNVLLTLMNLALRETAYKKLELHVTALYVDDCALKQWSQEKRLAHVQKILDLCKKFNVELHIISIDKYVSNILEISPIQDLSEKIIINDNDSKILTLFKSIKSSTAKRDMLAKIKKSLITRYAKLLKCSFVFLGDYSATLATQLLSNVSLGRGSQIGYEAGFCDSRYEDIKILRPMKDITREELLYFAEFHNIFTEEIAENTDNSIQNLMENFVKNLQVNFPATISTVCRTGEKVGDDVQNKLECFEECAICQAKLDTQWISSSALQATEFSRKISASGPNRQVVEPSNPIQLKSCENCNCKTKDGHILTRPEIEKYLCYGCRLIVRDLSDVDRLPENLIKSIKYKVSLESIKNEINEFLL